MTWTLDDLDKLWAYESSGCTCGCGECNEELRAFLQAGSEDSLRLVAGYAAKFLTEGAQEHGYGIEDVAEILRWALEDNYEKRR